MEEGGFEAIDVTEAGLREGVFFERYLARRNGGEALFDDVRRASVVNLAAQYGMSPDHNPHVAHVARLALELFDELAAAGLHPGEQRRARAAVGVGAAARHRDDDRLRRPPQALALPRPQRGLPGYAQREVALIGQAVRYHRKGMPSLGPFAAIADKGDEDRLRPDVRAAAARRGPRAQPRPARPRGARRARRRRGAPRPRVRRATRAVARWAAGREGELFERAFGRELVVR